MPDPVPAMSDDVFRLITALVADYAGLQFGPDRLPSVSSRLAPRLEATGSGTFLEYYHLMKYDGGAEIVQAVERLTNHETYFFREVGQLQFTAHLASKSSRRLRVLSAGCSTGEEPYTLAMILREAGLTGRVDIVGVDISGVVIERARAGLYSANAFRGVEGRIVQEYFTPDEGRLRLRPAVLRAASFDQMNLLDAEALSGLGTFDAVLCRNVLIHFGRESKARAVASLIPLLAEGAYLFLGHSESLYDIPNRLEMVRAGSVIAYRRPVSVAASEGGAS